MCLNISSLPLSGNRYLLFCSWMSGCLFIFLLAKRPFAKIEVAQKREGGERVAAPACPVSGMMGRMRFCQGQVSVGVKRASTIVICRRTWFGSGSHPISAQQPPIWGTSSAAKRLGGDLFIRKSLSSQRWPWLVGVRELGAWMLVQQGRLRDSFPSPLQSPEVLKQALPLECSTLGDKTGSL